jgi:hypothetical protein
MTVNTPWSGYFTMTPAAALIIAVPPFSAGLPSWAFGMARLKRAPIDQPRGVLFFSSIVRQEV